MERSVAKCLAALVYLLLLPSLAVASSAALAQGAREQGEERSLQLYASALDVDGASPDDWVDEGEAIVSPRLGLIVRASQKVELYLDGGLGFNGMDDGLATGVDLRTGELRRADARVRTYGAELGLDTNPFSNLRSTLTLWWLDVDSETSWTGESDLVGAGRPSRRYGFEWANVYRRADWLTFDAALSLMSARYRDSDSLGSRIPGSPARVIAAGAAVHDLGRFCAGLRLRYVGPSPLVESGSARAGPKLALSGQVGWALDDSWTLTLDILNALDRGSDGVTHYFASRLPDDPPASDSGGAEDLDFHALEPASVRLTIRGRF